MTSKSIQTEDFYSEQLETTYCLIDGDLYQLDEEDEWEPVEDPTEEEVEIQEQLASLPNPCARLFQRIDVAPYLTWKGISVPIPLPAADEDRPFVIPQDSTLGYLFQPLHQRKLVEDGVDVESPYGEQLEKYYKLLDSQVDDMYSLWFNDNKEFQEQAKSCEGAEHFESLMKLYENIINDDGFDDIGLHYTSSVVGDTFVIHLSYGDSDPVLDVFVQGSTEDVQENLIEYIQRINDQLVLEPDKLSSIGLDPSSIMVYVKEFKMDEDMLFSFIKDKLEENAESFDPTMDLDDWVSKEQLEQRIQYCLNESNRTNEFPDGKGGRKVVPGEWSAQYGARHLYLEGVYESWDDLDKDDQDRAEVYEMEYVTMLDSLCDEQGFPDVYENGLEGLYAWMVIAKGNDPSHIYDDLKEWMEKKDLPTPEWAKNPDSILFDFFHED